MARVSPDEVKEIVSTSLSDSAVLRYIDAASALTDTLIGRGPTDAVLVLIELQLAADLVYGYGGTVVSEKIGDASVQYRAGDHSDYWKAANRLSGGLLEELSLKRASFIID